MDKPSTRAPIVMDRYDNEADIWRDAWRIADPGASNPVAVARTLFKASSFVMSKGGTDDVRKHPALRVMAGQLSALYNTDMFGPDAGDLDKVSAYVIALDKAEDLTEKS